MVQFRPAAERGRYDPPVVEDFSADMKADIQRRSRLFDQYQAQLEKNARIEIEEAKNPNNYKGLETLAKFSGTAANYLQKNIEQTTKDIQEGEDWEYITGGRFNPEAEVAEDVASEAAELNLKKVVNTSNQIEADTGSPILANTYYQRNKGIGAGLQNEISLLKQATNNYPQFLSAYRNSNTTLNIGGIEKPISEWAMSADPAVQSTLSNDARYKYIKANGLQYTTKRNFNKYFGSKSGALEGNAANNAMSAAIKTQREEATNIQVGLTSDAAMSGGDPQEYLREDADATALIPGNSRSTANKKIVEAAINGTLQRSIASGTYSAAGLDAIANTYLRVDENGQGIKGSKVMNYPALSKMLLDARLNLQKLQAGEEVEFAAQTYASGVKRIQGAKTLEEKRNETTLLLQQLDSLGSAGDKWKRRVSADRFNLELGMDADANFRTLKELQGKFGSAGRGYITDEQARDLYDQGRLPFEAIAYFEEFNKPQALPAKSEASIRLKNANFKYANDLAELVGLSVSSSETGPIVGRPAKGSAINSDELQERINEVNLARRRVAIAAYYSLGGDATEKERTAAMVRELNEFDQQIKANPDSPYNMSSLGTVNYTLTSQTKINEALRMYEEAQQPGKSATEKEQLIKTAIERIRPNNGLGYIKDGKITDKGLQFISDFSRDVNKLRSTEAYQLNQMTDTIMKSQHYDVLEPIDFVDKPGTVANGRSYAVGEDMPITIINNYSRVRGDRVLDASAVIRAYEAKTGEAKSFPDWFKKAADQLKLSPTEFYNAQVLANGRNIDTAKYYLWPSQLESNVPKPDVPNSTDATVDADGNVINIGDPVGGYEGAQANGQGGLNAAGSSSAPRYTPRQGAEWFMNKYNVPMRGAAYLSGNINAESRWKPNESPWDDVGQPAGGLASWRADRLRQLEAYYGQPVEQLSTEQQLEYMWMELGKPQYAEAKRLFMLPNATQRQLIRASKIFWGYGVVGSRYIDAEQILQQLQE